MPRLGPSSLERILCDSATYAGGKVVSVLHLQNQGGVRSCGDLGRGRD